MLTVNRNIIFQNALEEIQSGVRSAPVTRRHFQIMDGVQPTVGELTTKLVDGISSEESVSISITIMSSFLCDYNKHFM